jgi:epoxyqueuosine reductase
MKSLLSLSEKDLSEFGVVDWGYTEESVPHSFQYFENWIHQGLQGPLNYLADHRKDLRRDIKSVYPEFKSALVFLFSYQETKKWMLENNKHEIAAYSLGFEGEDYHHAVHLRLERIFSKIKMDYINLERFVCLDTKPILERDLAMRAGLGWFGKNSMLINQKEGSYFIIGTLLLNETLSIEKPSIDNDHCGQCTACVDACPTIAINGETRTLEASKCISTYTIEVFKDAEPPIGFSDSRGEFFGCDICQDVCPWNKKPLARVVGQLKLKNALGFLKEWFFETKKRDLLKRFEAFSNRSLKHSFKGTAFDRPGKMGWIKNIKALLSNSNQNDV